MTALLAEGKPVDKNMRIAAKIAASAGSVARSVAYELMADKLINLIGEA